MQRRHCKVMFLSGIDVDSVYIVSEELKRIGEDRPRQSWPSLIHQLFLNNSIGTNRKFYDYNAPYELDLKLGSIVVVEARQDGIKRLAVAMVVAINTEPMDIDVQPYSFIYGEVSLELVVSYKDRERRLKNLEMQMAAREAEYGQLNRYRQLAETDQGMADLIKEYEVLTGGRC